MRFETWIVTFLVFSSVLAGQEYDQHEHSKHDQDVDNTLLVEPIPQDIDVNRDIAKLGWVLFNDPNLSSNQAVSCESCHDLATNGAETTRVSTGVNGIGLRNSLTVFNSALNYRFFWDGRANTLEDQIDGPITNPLEMDSDWPQIERYVSRSASYKQLFSSANDLPISRDTIRFALAEFVRTLQTPDSTFDRFLQGDSTALSAQELRGWETFQTVGCVQCHQGKNIGGNMIQKFGYFTSINSPQDTGKHLITDQGQDKFYFRVASLRNVAQTPPYFHDGRTKTLETAIRIMAKGQLGITMENDTIADIEAFLHTLSAPRPSILEEFENE
ncbi:cytochrome c551 peroxidase [Vibrio ichthyoenteri ATCC 700023]|uniref:Cytochrome c551 peroxidase n=1 Tax=Vibrio ichthyoenteri ATCC 700023 TaxID=870968 RepID=F9RXU0_9VIBR|nr:cytochrome c peroxidase [Vibrio ichthyoenteri]EGU47471.1 cytochrome c551 peroxidase [Vibrio ichthyoenteri ATCC 700023]